MVTKMRGRVTITEGRHLASVMERVANGMPLREAVRQELADVLGDKPHWKRRLTKLAEDRLKLKMAAKPKKIFAPARKTRIVSPALLMGARNHERELVKGVPEHDR